MRPRRRRDDVGVEELLTQLCRLAREFVRAEDELPQLAGRTPDRLRNELGIALPQHGASFPEVVEKLRAVLALTPSSASSRFFNQLFGGREPVATLAEMLSSLANTSMYTYKMAGPQVLIEQEVLARMAHLAGYENGEGTLCPGGSLANMTAMVLARNELHEQVREDGLSGHRLTVYVSDQAHYSIPKNASLLGMGRSNVRWVPSNVKGEMIVTQLQRLVTEDLDHGASPVIIVATAGTTVMGAFDPIGDIAEIADEHGVWLHVDGALGGSMLLCPEHRSALAGIERADSFLWNAHKMLGVPLPCSALLLRRQGLLAKHLNETADYLFQDDDDELSPGTRSLQCGRRNDALKLWALWQLLGDEGLARKVSRQLELARHAADLIRADPELVLAAEPASVNVCFEVRNHSSRGICKRLDDEGRLKISWGPVNGRRCLRLVCVDAELTETDLATVLEEIKQVAATLEPADNHLERGPRELDTPDGSTLSVQTRVGSSCG